MRKTLVYALAVGLSCLVCRSALAQEKAAPAAKKTAPAAKKPMHVVMTPGDIKWGDAPPNLPAGAKIAVLQGDPGKPGPFTIRLKLPNGYKVAAHWHPMAEYLTVLSGTFYIGTGDKLDESKGTALSPGGFLGMPAKMRHYAWTKGETEIEVHGNGPFKIVYVNPADDPSKGAKPPAKSGRS
jgi:quercetin dioxygenase-like cupin family protein